MSATEPLLLRTFRDKGDVAGEDCFDDVGVADADLESEVYGRSQTKSRKQWWNKLPKLHFYALVVVLGPITLLLSLSPTLHRPLSIATWEPSNFWGPYVDEDAGIQSFMKAFYHRRQRAHEAHRSLAEKEGKKRNDRSLDKGSPIVVYWPDPPYYWKEYGTGKGEHIKMWTCPISCELVSGSPDDPEQDKAHLLLQYNIFRGTLKGLKEKEKKELMSWQKAVLFSLEPNTFTLGQEEHLEMFDLTATLSRHSEIFFETYSPGIFYQNRKIGLDEVTTSSMADEIWGPNRDLTPTRKLLEKVNVPPELRNGTSRIATFISNCYSEVRNKFIKALVEEGVEFDHYGKCKEDVFGGTPPPYSLDYEKDANLGQFQKLTILSLYKFNLVLENSVFTDYVSEKVTQGLYAGGIPIICGAPNLSSDLQPPGSPQLFINCLEYSPAELAALIRKLDTDPVAWNKYRSWLKDVPGDSRLVEYTKRTSRHNGAQDMMQFPICEICQFYQEYYDWEGESPLKF